MSGPIAKYVGAAIFHVSFLPCSPGLSWRRFPRQPMLREQDGEEGWRGVRDTPGGLACPSMALRHRMQETQDKDKAAQAGR